MKKFYKCDICGSIFGVIEDGGVVPMCCGSDMVELEANTSDGASEKHVPVVERSGLTLKVKVGSVAHPMDDAHFIQWIIAVQGNKTQRFSLKPGEAPEAEFTLDCESESVTVYEYCNLHGLWTVNS